MFAFVVAPLNRVAIDAESIVTINVACGVDAYVSVNVDTKLPLKLPLLIVGFEPVIAIVPLTIKEELIAATPPTCNDEFPLNTPLIIKSFTNAVPLILNPDDVIGKLL